MEIRVDVIGGRWDGSEALCKNLTPGTVMILREDRYQIAWVNGSPRLVPTS